MQGIALSVGTFVRSGTHADVAWIVADEGYPSRDRGEALAVTPGGGKVGELLGGALNDHVAALIAEGATSRLLDIEVDEITRLIAGLDSAGEVRCLVAPAEMFPADFWDDVWSGRPACVVAHVDGDRVIGIDVHEDASALGEEVGVLFARGVTESLVESDRVVTVLFPVPRLAVVGGGPICDAVEEAAKLLGWHVYHFLGAGEASPLLMGFGPLDMVLVAIHDVDASGSALAAALNGRAGYIGALGSPAMAAARLDWLTTRGVPGLERIHGPAGLDIGARKPAEVAIAVIAEALAVRKDQQLAG